MVLVVHQSKCERHSSEFSLRRGEPGTKPIASKFTYRAQSVLVASLSRAQARGRPQDHFTYQHFQPAATVAAVVSPAHETCLAHASRSRPSVTPVEMSTEDARKRQGRNVQKLSRRRGAHSARTAKSSCGAGLVEASRRGDRKSLIRTRTGCDTGTASARLNTMGACTDGGGMKGVAS